MNHIRKTTKTNQLIKSWPRGTIKTVTELKRLGYSPQLLKMYSNSGWIELYSRGVYKLSEDKITWMGVLYGIQNKTETTIHAGARTALELKGFGHFAREADKYFFGKRDESYSLVLKNFQGIVLKKTEVFPYNEKNFFTNHNAGNFEIKISAAELAAMEMIYSIPSEQSFNEVMLIMENLTTLRPDLVQQLLQKVDSFKVKRIFMWMAEKNNHAWIKELNLEKVDFGKGKISIVKDGSLDKKYQITVPKEYEQNSIF
ncbi:MAG: type IV toxin-antitoxin system AbiEi family antitoxin [Ignavibacteriae bacterium]|nr:type IV toxin-antitoxin system AbiEi family antitoxin [Ignavibacteriota bacterium]